MARPSLQHVRTVLAAEFAAIRNRDPDIDAGDVTSFTMPLLLGLLGVLAIGVVPLIVVRSSVRTDSLLVPLAGSLALAAICTAVVAWLTAIVLSGLVVMVLYRTRPKAASRLVLNTVVDSFGRVEDITGRIALLAIVAGLLSLAIGLPNRHGDESGATVLDDLLAAQVACLVGALSIAFVAESIRCAADIVDDQSMLLAWPWALIMASGLVAGHRRRSLRDDARAVDPAQRMAAARAGRYATGPVHRPVATRLGAVVGRLRTAARHLGDLGLRGLAARRAQVHPRVPRRQRLS